MRGIIFPNLCRLEATIMNDAKQEPKKKQATQEAEPADPVHTIREGAVAASIWQRQSLSGYAYYDFSLSRSWKSMSSNKTGYSKNFFARNGDELKRVIERAAQWIVEHETAVASNQNCQVGEVANGTFA
jgi:hypothetical protein